MKKKSMVAIDLSMRSTGIVRLSLKNKLIDFDIIKNNELNYEELLVWNTDKILKFCKKDKPSYIAFEGLSLMGKSGSKDMIQGNFWHARCMIRKEFGDKMLIGSIPVLTWRNNILSKDELKEAKGIREGLKIFVVNKLPKHVKNNFEKYIEKNKLEEKTIYDLADAFFIGVHRNLIEND